MSRLVWSIYVLSLMIGCLGHQAVLGFQEQINPSVNNVDFRRDIQPILANHCWSCHGPDSQGRKGDLRLDLRDHALGSNAIVPNDAAASEMIRRIESISVDEVMPPPTAKKPLDDRQKQLLKEWINQGAQYAEHWAFTPPQASSLPQVSDPSWPINSIDFYVLERLDREGMKPSPRIDRGALLRRVTLDLTGLPPTQAELDSFLADTQDGAYERVVDRLLQSPAYAEKMALSWLDLARYADTNGYNNDEDRTMWPWRDWVIRSFDKNIPYDQFIIEQLAGDLLPNPTRDQLVATAFLRNQGHNTEGGIIPEEYRVEYVADRVHTTATVFLGLSMQCARCHDHKYDPITQEDFYRYYAFFNNMDEKQASYSKFVAAEPSIRVPTEAQEKQAALLRSELESLSNSLAQIESETRDRLQRWQAVNSIEQIEAKYGIQQQLHLKFDPSQSPTLIDSLSGEPRGVLRGNVSFNAGKDGTAVVLDGSNWIQLDAKKDVVATEAFSLSCWVNPVDQRSMGIASKMDEERSHRGFDLLLENGKVVTHWIDHWPDNAIKVSTKNAIAPNQWHHIVLSYDGSRKASGIKIFVDGQTMDVDVLADKLSGTIDHDRPFHLGRRQRSLPFVGELDELRIFHNTLTEDQAKLLFEFKAPTSIAVLLTKPMSELNEEEKKKAMSFYLTNVDDDYRAAKASMGTKEFELKRLEEEYPAVMILREMEKPRETFILNRGQYDQPTKLISIGVPEVIGAFPQDAPANRLGLAKWLVSERQPLTARVAVNRWWQSYFGTGLVKTVEDFGITGEQPSHPELLDFLAVEFMRSKWDVKGIQKLIVMSATYQQDSKVTEDTYERDPENRLLARGSRYRLSAETIRDSALAVSGLLKPKVGGPSVKPYQPAGLWEDVTVERRGKYVADQGEGLYRRSMYTFWKRTCPPPSMMSFDAPNREVCLVRRARTNTPLQSLVLMNDPTYVEAARQLAAVALHDPALDFAQRVDKLYRQVLSRSASDQEKKVLERLRQKCFDQWNADPTRAKELLKVGDSPVGLDASGKEYDPVELASWTILASTVLNLDEAISRR